MKADQGDTVIVVGVYSVSDHTGTQPAIVTRVFDRLTSDHENISARVNLTVFTDGMVPATRASVPYYESLIKANEVQARMPFCYPKPKHPQHS
jgi:hypothetical protein